MPLYETTSYRNLPTSGRKIPDLLSNPTKHYPVATQIFDAVNRPGNAHSTSFLGIPKRSPSSSSASTNTSASSITAQYASLEVSTKYSSYEEKEKENRRRIWQRLREEGDKQIEDRKQQQEQEQKQEQEQQARDHQVACQIFTYTYNGVELEEYANFLGQRGNEGILKEFMQLLRPLPLSLLSVLQKISDKIYFVAEAQAIDKILEEASKVYVVEHSNTVWLSNYKLCHIILFSLLILNSDLHNDNGVAGKQSRFSSNTFIENTLSALQSELDKSNPTNLDLQQVRTPLSHELLSYYEALKYKPLALLNLKKARRISAAILFRNENSAGPPTLLARRSFDSHYTVSSFSLEQPVRSLGVSAFKNTRVSRSNSASSRSTTKAASFSGFPTSNLASSGAATTYEGHSVQQYTGQTQLQQNSDHKYKDLYLKEGFDIEMNKRNNSFWYVDAIIKMNDQDVTRLKRKFLRGRRNPRDTSIKKLGNNDVNAKGSKVADIDIASAFNSMDTSASVSSLKDHRRTNSSTTSMISTPATSKHSRLLGWLRGKSSSSSSSSTSSKSSKSFPRATATKQSMSYLDDTSRYIPVRLKVSEGRAFLYLAEATETPQTNTTTAISSVPSYCFTLFETLASVVQENIIQGTVRHAIDSDTTRTDNNNNNNNSNNSNNRRGNFTLLFPKDTNDEELVLEFETKSVTEALSFVNSLNFWAGRLALPLPVSQFEIVSNEEYGWSEKILGLLSGSYTRRSVVEYLNTKVLVSQWRPLSKLDVLHKCCIDEMPEAKVKLEEKIRELESFTGKVGQLIDQHNEVKPKLVELWQDTLHFDKVMDNWNERYLFLNNQYKRRKIYSTTLQRAWRSLSGRSQNGNEVT